MNNTNNALETLVQRDKQIKKTNDKLKASINELDAELETHASNTNIHTSKEELIQLIVDHLESLDLGITKEVVSVLPTENISDNTLYFVPNDKGSRDEYFYINDKWELVGSTETNFTDYYTKLETNTLLEGKANSVHTHVVDDITDFPTIPTKVSELTNDSGYITGVAWGDITSKPELSQVAISGSYSDLSGTPTIPTKTSELINDSGYITSISWTNITDKPNFSTVATSGSYTDLSNTPTIPTKLSQLENDMGFGTGGSGDTSDCVHKTGNETIAGTKTFTVGPVTSNNATTNGYFIKNTAIGRGEVPSKMYHNTFRVLDKNNNIFGEFCVEKSTTGSTLVHINARSEDSNGKQLSESLYLNMSNDGSAVRFYPSSNNKMDLGMSNNKWAKIYSDDVVHTSGNEIIDGIKTFTSILKISQGTLQVGSDAGYSVTYSWSGDIISKQPSGTYNIALPKANGTLAIDENLVHRTGNETINGVKSFGNLMYIYNNMSNKNSQMDLLTTPSSTLYAHYMFMDKNNQVTAYMQYGQQNTGTDFIGLFIHDKTKALHGIQVTTNNEVIPISHMTYSLGSASRVWNNAYISRIYCANIVSPVENSYIYMTAGPSWNNGASIFLNCKSGDGNGSGNGTFTLYARNTTAERYLLGRPDGILNWTGCVEAHEVRATTGNAFMAQNGGYTFLIRNDGSNTYFLMSEKDATPGTWSSARPLILNNSTGVCSINGNANTATYSTTPATTDNSTRIATTAWVRTYVNSVAGSGSVGASISAYYSNATTVTATGSTTGGGGGYPDDYSDYINIAPTVGTIYTGSQLFSSFTPTASGTINKVSTGPSSIVYQTTASAKATFSGAFSASAKYLCTTANAVKFRAYVSQGTSSAMGTPSVVDNSSTKSIFIRVQ